jgi:hypothetical protein
MGSRYLEQRDDMERLYFERCLVHFEKLKSNEPTIANAQVSRLYAMITQTNTHFFVLVWQGCYYHVLVHIHDGRPEEMCLSAPPFSGLRSTIGSWY